MPVYKGRKTVPRRVECRIVGCIGELLDRTVKELNDDGWNIRQIYHEPPKYYRVFAQRETEA
jgi:DNA-binding HxlR family transcriptional regulator